MKNYLLPTLALVISIAALYSAISVADDMFGFASGWENAYSSGITSASSTLSATAALVLSANNDRQIATIVNDGSVVAYCHKTATSTGVTAQTGIRLNASGGTLEFNKSDDPYTGALYCITQSGTSTLSVSYK